MNFKSYEELREWLKNHPEEEDEEEDTLTGEDEL